MPELLLKIIPANQSLPGTPAARRESPACNKSFAALATCKSRMVPAAREKIRLPLFGKNCDVDFSVAIDPAAEHAFGIERCREVALRVERDHSAVSAELRHDFHHDFFRRLGDRLALVF